MSSRTKLRSKILALGVAAGLALTSFAGAAQATAAPQTINGWTKADFIQGAVQVGAVTAEQASAAWGDLDKMASIPVQSTLEDQTPAATPGPTPRWALPAEANCLASWKTVFDVELANLAVKLRWQYGTVGAIHVGTDTTPWANHLLGWSFDTISATEDYKNGLNWHTGRFANFKFSDGYTQDTLWVRIEGYNNGSHSCSQGTP